MPADISLLFQRAASVDTRLDFDSDVSEVGGIALVFGRVPDITGDLVFGDGDGVPRSDVDAAITGSFPAPTLSLTVAPVVGAEVAAAFAPLAAAMQIVIAASVDIVGSFPRPTLTIAVQYASNTARPTVGESATEWQQGSDLQSGATYRHQVATAKPAGYADTATQATQRPSLTHSGWQRCSAIGGTFYNLQHTQATQTRRSTQSVFDNATHSPRLVIATDFQAAYEVHTSTWLSHQDGDRTQRTTRSATYQNARKLLAKSQRGALVSATRHMVAYRAYYQGARRAPPGVRTVVPVVPITPQNTNLVFCGAWAGVPDLIFNHCAVIVIPGDPSATTYILPARFYMTAHTIIAHRLPDLAEVPIFEATVSADSGSFCWTLQASGPAGLFEQLAPAGGLPVQLRLTLDGMPWVFAVDSLKRTQAFGKSGVSISGRSVTALIGAPYLRAIGRDNAADDRLAQQLAIAALDTTGIDLDWGLTDWLVPAGAWSHQGTPLDAVQAIAQAAGGYLQSHRSAPTLLTRHPYANRAGDHPGAPWGWSTGPADVELAMDAIITQGTERRDGADINAIYVSGTTHGVLGRVKRVGTAADKLAAMATDPLITHVDAARQRGLATLGMAGPQYSVSLDLPVLTGLDQPGVLDVGQLVQVNASTPWRGRVRSVSVSAKRPSLRQTITLERHL